MTWLSVRCDEFRWTGRKPRVFRSSSHGRRFFCGVCGTQLAFTTTKERATIDLSVATLRRPERFPPTRDIWLSHKLPWVPLAKGLKRERGETIASPP